MCYRLVYHHNVPMFKTMFKQSFILIEETLSTRL